MPLRVGVMGGTFNPVHFGHLRAAEEALEMLGLDDFLFIPSAVPPHKSNREILPFEHRWEMMRLAVRGHPVFRLSDLEHRLGGTSYTVTSLRKLREEMPDGTVLYFLVGMDAFLELDLWWRYRELFRMACMVALRRPGYPGEQMDSFLAAKVSRRFDWDERTRSFRHPEFHPVHHLEITHMGISSTQVRRLASRGKSIRYLVPDAVLSYIRDAGLYGIGS